MNNVPDKRSIIISAAENLFERFGFQKTSLEDIAKEAELGKGTIYYYFESKEDIFVEVIKEHAAKFYGILIAEIAVKKNFEEKFSTAIKLPIKLIYEHAPTLLEAIKSLPINYLQKLDAFRDTNKQKMIDILHKVIEFGIKQGDVSDQIPVEKIVYIIFDWFLMGDTNVIIKNPVEFIKKAEHDYDLIVKLMLNGIIKRG